jgi:hypothetical protein
LNGSFDIQNVPIVLARIEAIGRVDCCSHKSYDATTVFRCMFVEESRNTAQILRHCQTRHRPIMF